MLDSPCQYHTLNPRRPAGHKTKECSWHARTRREGAEGNKNSAPPRYPPRAPARQAPQATGPNAEAVRPNQATRPTGTWQENVNTVVGPNPAPPQKNTSYINNPKFHRNNVGPSRPNEYREHHQAYMVFVTESMDKHSLKRRSMEVNATMLAVPIWMEWSDMPIVWNCRDQPDIMPNPGGYALVVDPVIVGPKINVKFSRVLIDNGSSINIMYKDTMEKLGIKKNMLSPTGLLSMGS